MTKPVRMSAARYRLLSYFNVKYAWMPIPRPEQRPARDKRIFTSRNLNAFVQAGYLKYQPARAYLTGKGRKALKDHLRQQREKKHESGQ